MKNMQPQQQYKLGMVGLGVMGRNLVLDMTDLSFSGGRLTLSRLLRLPE